MRNALEEGTDINIKNDKGWTALMGASMNGHLEIVELLIEKGADVNDNIIGTTVLMCASLNGHIEIVEFLIDNGADVNVRDSRGSNVLKYASKNGHEEIVRILKDAGALE